MRPELLEELHRGSAVSQLPFGLIAKCDKEAAYERYLARKAGVSIAFRLNR